jgi:cation:H+ antiporter
MEHLIPTAWFTGAPQWGLLLTSAIAIALLGKGADWLVDGASGLAYRMGISKVIVGATIVSLGTTSPEAAVSVVAAWSGQPGLALGNAIGSIIADSGLIFGLGCLIAVLPADRFVLARQGWVQFGSGMLLAIVCYGAWWMSGADATIGRAVGVLFLLLLAFYLAASIRWSRQHPHGEPFQGAEEGAAPHGAGGKSIATRAATLLAGLCLIGLTLVIVSSHILVQSVTELAEAHWHVPKVVIAGTLVALGTSLPELVIGVASIMKGHREILVGNVIGADILNVLFVIGASAVAAPLPIIESGSSLPMIALYLHVPTMILILVLFRLFIRSATRTGHFRRWYGVPLVAIYVAYAALQYIIT